MRRAADGFWGITGDTATHAAYGVGPASDYATNRGTTLRAPWAGVISTYTSNTGGLTIVVDGRDATWFGQHNDAYYMTRGHADEGDPVAASGNTGSSTTGPHTHQWVIDNNGQRWSFEEWIALQGMQPAGLGDVVGPQIGSSTSAGTGGTTILNPLRNQGDTDMRVTRDTDNNNAVVAGYLLPPYWLRRSELGAAYDSATANAASIGSENPNRFPGEVLDQLFKDGTAAHAKYIAQFPGSTGGGDVTQVMQALKDAIARFPTVESIGAEVIRQQKLPGN